MSRVITKKILQYIWNVQVLLFEAHRILFGKCRYVDCQEEITSPPGIYICERWKAQTRLLFVVESHMRFFRLMQQDAVRYSTKFVDSFNIYLTVISRALFLLFHCSR